MPSHDPTSDSAPFNGTTPHAALKFDSIPSCIEAFRAGHFLIVLDSPSRENEGDLIIAASALTPRLTSFLIHHSSGYLCAPLPASLASSLQLPSMVPPTSNTDPNRTAYTITVDAAHGVTTGISATDRSRTCNLLGAEGTVAEDLRRPGHVVPLIARAGGVRERRGHTEAGWEFCRLAGYEPAVAVIGELVEEMAGGEMANTSAGAAHDVNGTATKEAPIASESKDEGPGRPGYSSTGMMRAEGCLAFGRKHGIKVCTIEDLVAYVEQEEGTSKT